MSLNLVKHCVISVPPWWLWEMKELIGQLLVFVQWPMWPTRSWSGNTLSALNLLHLYKEIPFQARYTSYNWMVSHFVFLVEWLNIPSSKTQHYFQKKKKRFVEKVEPHLAVFLEQTLTESDPTEFHWFTQNVNVCIQSVHSTPLSTPFLFVYQIFWLMLSATNKTAVLKGVALPI